MYMLIVHDQSKNESPPVYTGVNRSVWYIPECKHVYFVRNRRGLSDS